MFELSTRVDNSKLRSDYSWIGYKGFEVKMTKIMTLLLALYLCTPAVGAEIKQITVKLTVPDSAWTIVIDEVHKVDNEIWVISSVSRDPNMMGAQVISTVQDTVKLVAPDLFVKHFVMGKKWGWKNKEPYTFIKNSGQIEKDLKTGKLLYRKAKKDLMNFR